MEKAFDKYYLLDGEIGYPRFTKYRRQLSEMVNFAEEILKVMSEIYGLDKVPEVKFQYFVQKADCKELASGFYTAYLFDDKSVDYHFIGINFSDTKENFNRIFLETVPHEIAHLLHYELDPKDQEKNGHGEMFDQISRLIEFQFPQVKILHNYPIHDWESYMTRISEDAHSFKLR